MSIVPNNDLQSADSLELVIFEEKLTVDSASQSIDIYSRHTGYWKSCVIRNYQPSDVLLYRRNPNDVQRVVQPNSELPLKGWGSYLQIESSAATPDGLVEFECVTYKDAVKK